MTMVAQPLAHVEQERGERKRNGKVDLSLYVVVDNPKLLVWFNVLKNKFAGSVV